MLLESPIKPLPPTGVDFDTKPILKSLISAGRRLAELKGTARTLPNQGILIDTLFMQEALASSKIENIITTHDEAYQASLFAEGVPIEAKEVARYQGALTNGFRTWQAKNLITENLLIGMFRILMQRDDGYRTTPGTVLRNERTGEAVYKPPQDPQTIIALMRGLERFINDDSSRSIDPLIKMALIHHQFETIHPFPDGNGRVGRMLNVLYLVHSGLLDVPILYLSRAINRTRPDYYRLLQAARNDGAWEAWVVYMLNAVEETAIDTLDTIKKIRDLMQSFKHSLRSELPKLYSQDLLNTLFQHPYTRIEHFTDNLHISRPTATSYLKQLAAARFISAKKKGRYRYYINDRLCGLFTDALPA